MQQLISPNDLAETHFTKNTDIPLNAHVLRCWIRYYVRTYVVGTIVLLQRSSVV